MRDSLRNLFGGAAIFTVSALMALPSQAQECIGINNVNTVQTGQCITVEAMKSIKQIGYERVLAGEVVKDHSSGLGTVWASMFYNSDQRRLLILLRDQNEPAPTVIYNLEHVNFGYGLTDTKWAEVSYTDPSIPQKANDVCNKLYEGRPHSIAFCGFANQVTGYYITQHMPPVATGSFVHEGDKIVATIYQKRGKSGGIIAIMEANLNRSGVSVDSGLTIGNVDQRTEYTTREGQFVKYTLGAPSVAK